MRNSNQRNLIYEIVVNRYDHPTAEQVFVSARNTLSNISLSTVYRNLNELADRGLIKKVSIANDSDRFDSTLKNHSHLYCIKCRGVYDVKDIDLQDIINDVEEKNKIKVLSNDLSFEGICSKCQK